jgi:ABC-type polysaccharide/polyol phosphate transport system ATPase subunit
MSDVAIRVEGLSKRYRRWLPRGDDRLTEVVSNLGRGLLQAAARRLRPAEGPAPPAPQWAGEFWALKDISFEVKHGEVVGIVGRNGAGKSTLLKILSRITEPTGGRFGLAGRVGSLLEVGTGFHPDLTGRENVFLNGTFLGMSRREIARKFDAIAAFAEIDDFLDTPVKHYSSGMHVRLGFSVAAHLEPEILIVDEALGVGDAAFQKKCQAKMREMASSGRTVLVVSHNAGAVRELCSRAFWLDHGEMLAMGPVDQVLDQYSERLAGAAPPRRNVVQGTVELEPSPSGLPISGEFSAGPGEHFRPQAGQWRIAGGRLTTRPNAGEEALITLWLTDPTPTRLQVEVGLTPDETDARGPSNGFVLFDYTGPERFKFAGCYVRLGKWAIGERSEKGWISAATLDIPPQPGREHALALVMDAPLVRLQVDGVGELVHRFDHWDGGVLGFGARGAVAHFRRIGIRATG